MPIQNVNLYDAPISALSPSETWDCCHPRRVRPAKPKEGRPRSTVRVYRSNSMSWDLCPRFWRVLPPFLAAFAPRAPLLCTHQLKWGARAVLSPILAAVMGLLRWRLAAAPQYCAGAWGPARSLAPEWRVSANVRVLREFRGGTNSPQRLRGNKRASPPVPTH